MIHPHSRSARFFKRLSGYFAAIPSRPDARWALVLAGLAIIGILAVAYVGTQTDLKYQWQRRDTIAELRELPLGQVKVRGVVTYVDTANKRFWLQDETGAIIVNQNPALADVHFGDGLQVEMKKTHAYYPTIGNSSLGLTDFKVLRSRKNAPLPLSATAAIPTLAEQAKTGIRVTVEGVAHSVNGTRNGLVKVDVGDEGQEVEAIVPGNPHQFAQWLNARVRITGVLEVLPDEGWGEQTELIWAQNTTDMEKISNASPSSEVSTIRTLYAKRSHIGGHQVRLRGSVLYQESPEKLIVEDEWGAIGCSLDQPSDFAPGTPIEVQGFLKKQGLAINLVHSTATSFRADQQRRISASIPVSTIANVRALAEKIIQTAPPVKVTGVITYLDTEYQQFFLQDSTAGIFIKFAGTPVKLYRGQKIIVDGLVNDGDFAPVIVAPKFTSLGPAPLPKPSPMDMRAKFGVLDSLYGEVEGVVHPITEKQLPNRTTFYLYTALGPVHVNLQGRTQSDFMAGLQDATVLARGVVGEIFNSRKQLIGLQLSISNLKDIEVIESGSSNPFAVPATPISNLLMYSPHARPDHWAVVSGTVTMLGNEFFYIQDQTGGVRIEGNTVGLQLHDAVSAAGYATPTGYSPVLKDAVVKIRSHASTVASKLLTADMISDGHFDSQLVTVDASLLSVENSAGARTLSVKSGGHTFQAILYPSDTGQPFSPP
jgi:hypothetical protein